MEVTITTPTLYLATYLLVLWYFRAVDHRVRGTIPPQTLDCTILVAKLTNPLSCFVGLATQYFQFSAKISDLAGQ